MLVDDVARRGEAWASHHTISLFNSFTIITQTTTKNPKKLKAETEGEEKINASYQGLYKQTVDILKGLGVEPVPTVGTPFDPALHDAIAREASDDVADGTVLTEFRKGFELKGTLIRPAMVKVSYTDAPAEASAAETVEEGGGGGGGGVTDEDGGAAAAAE